MRNSIRFAVVLLAGLVFTAAFCAGAAAGAEDQPAGPKAPPPGSPRAVVITFFRSFSDGNASALRDSVLADGDAERQVADGMARVATAVAAARKAVVGKFNVRDRDVNVHIIPVEMFADMKENVVDDTASLLQDGHEFIALKKVNGVWKIALGELLKKGGKTTDQTMKELHGSIARVDEVTRQIEAGKFTNADEAAKAISEAVPTQEGPGK